MQEKQCFLSESDAAMADIETSYFDANSNTWDMLSELFFEYNGVHPHPKYDLLHWFKIKFHWHEDRWLHIDEIIQQ